MSRYARKLTKQDLIDGGITNITPTGRVFKHGEEIELAINSSGYRYFSIYDRDENNCCIKKTIAGRSPSYYTYKMRAISLQRAMWAWFYGEVPAGFVIDHIDNCKDNYDINNFQLLTPGENVNKEKDWNTKETKCDMHKSREFYEKKLEKFLAEYDTAKYVSNAEKAHHLRSKISQTRARIRYWDSHKNEYDEYIAQKSDIATKKANWKQSIRDRKLLAQWKDHYKEKGDTYMWHMLCEVIKNWDSYDDIVKDSIFATLHGNIGNFNTVGKFSDEESLK